MRHVTGRSPQRVLQRSDKQLEATALHDLDKALSNIGDIRSSLASNARFRGFGPGVVAITGLVVALTTTAQLLWPQWFAANSCAYLKTWIAVAIVTTIVTIVEMITRCHRLHGSQANAMLINTIEQFLPAGIAGAMVSAVIVKFTPDQMWLLPGLWQLFMALGIFAAARSLTRAVNIIAGWYFVTGVVVMILCATDQQLSPWYMGLPFIIGQLSAAVILYITCESDTE